jgi:hypothetical protein
LISNGRILSVNADYFIVSAVAGYCKRGKLSEEMRRVRSRWYTDVRLKRIYKELLYEKTFFSSHYSLSFDKCKHDMLCAKLGHGVYNVNRTIGIVSALTARI